MLKLLINMLRKDNTMKKIALVLLLSVHGTTTIGKLTDFLPSPALFAKVMTRLTMTTLTRVIIKSCQYDYANFKKINLISKIIFMPKSAFAATLFVTACSEMLGRDPYNFARLEKKK